MISRLLSIPNKSFLLFGPRGTGKSTLLRHKLKANLEINLLLSKNYIQLKHNPSLIEEWTAHLKKGDWVLIDEIQKIPELLDEVHALYEEKKLNFALSGSSARKLKRGGANLLAARALQEQFFPLVFNEYHDVWSIKLAVDYGSLPGVVTDSINKEQTLFTYIETYLKQELIEEGLIRKLDPFLKFLRYAGIYNAQVLNIENLSREAAIGRTTVDSYFEILEETLIGNRLPGIQLNLFKKETIHPKFYFFDSGIARAAAGYSDTEIDSTWRGHSFEALVYNELRAFIQYRKKNRNIFHYRISGGNEIDFLIELTKKTITKKSSYLAIEVKFSKTWDRRWSQILNQFIDLEKSPIEKAVGIYTGDKILTQGNVTIYPVSIFLNLLYKDEFF